LPLPQYMLTRVADLTPILNLSPNSKEKSI